MRNKKHESSEEDAMMMERLVELTGSVEAADEFIADSKEKGLFDTSQFTDNLERLAPGVFGVFNRDNSVEDDSILNNWVNLKKIKNEGGKFLNAEKLRPGKRRQALNIKIDSPAGEELITVLSSGVNTVTGEVAQFDVNKNAGGFAIFESGADSVMISGRQKVKGGFAPYQIELLKTNLPASISQAVSFETDQPIFDRTNMKPLDSQVSFNTMNDRRAFLDATYFTGSQKIALASTKEGLLQNLYDFYPDVMGNKVEPSPYAAAVNNMLESNNVFVKIEKEDDGNFYHKIVSKNLETNIETNLTPPMSNAHPIPEKDYDEAYRKTKRVPQLYVAQIINDAVAQAQASPENPSEAMVNILKLYGR